VSSVVSGRKVLPVCSTFVAPLSLLRRGKEQDILKDVYPMEDGLLVLAALPLRNSLGRPLLLLLERAQVPGGVYYAEGRNICHFFLFQG
jgi:hypothetical protein